MPRKSTKENKNIYQKTRESRKLSREKASEIVMITTDRLYSIEHDDLIPHPDEVLAMADGYKAPALCNYYCSHDCELGKQYVPEVKTKELGQITLEMLASLTSLSKERDRLIEISLDGKVSPSEAADFNRIQSLLNDMSMIIDSLNLWIENQSAK